MANDQQAFARWAGAWLAPAKYKGAHVPDVEARIENVMTLWTAPVPNGWERSPDRRLLDRSKRYLRGDAATLKTGSEHELEHELLDKDPAETVTTCFGARLIDGLNAVPLAHDTAGGRRGNIEADMLLLTEHATGRRAQLLVEAKTSSNNAWYAVIESLRQLKLFQLSRAARNIFKDRQSHDGTQPPVEAVVLAPATFYTSRGAKRNAVEPARRLIASLEAFAEITIHLAVWDSTRRTLDRLT